MANFVNMKRTLSILPILAILLVSASCSKEARQYPPRTIRPIYEDIARYATLDSAARSQMAGRDSLMFAAYLAVLGCDHMSDSLLTAISLSRPVEVYTPEVRKVFPTLEAVEEQLGYFLGSAADLGLDINCSDYGAVVWGWNQSIVFYDSRLMLIALNHYLGAEHEAYTGFPSYRRMVKTPQMLPYDMAESLTAQSYPFAGGESTTLLSHMLYDGALTYIKMHTVSDATPAMAMGFSDGQLQWLTDNEARIWQTMIGRKLLYDTSSFTIDRVMSPAPSTDIINAAAPGRTGRYIGYRIVCAYMDKNKDTKPTYLLSPAFYNSENTLAASGYAPK